jgi:integrase
MNLVQPIRHKEQIEEMKRALLDSGYRDYMLFVLGINTGLRISDLLQLQVADVRDKTHVTITEGKTDKTKRFFLNPQLQEEIASYIQGMDDHQYLFESQKGENRPISRVQAYRVLSKAAKAVGLEEVGTHTMRKTFGYWHYREFGDVAELQQLFNHSSQRVTLDYIGISQDETDKRLENFFL